MNNFCVECGAKLVPLFVHLICPNDCDKKPGGAQQRKANLQCFCGSNNTADFEHSDEGDFHCWDCGRVWFK